MAGDFAPAFSTRRTLKSDAPSRDPPHGRERRAVVEHLDVDASEAIPGLVEPLRGAVHVRPASLLNAA